MRRTYVVLSTLLLSLTSLNVLANNGNLNVCEAKKRHFNQNQCIAFTGPAWNASSANSACENGLVTYGQAGEYEQFRCDPIEVKGVCFRRQGKAYETARCAAGDNAFTCRASGGKWEENPEVVASTCFPEAPEDKPMVNESESLEEILEYGEIYGACEAYFADVDNASRRDMLLCGKWMYFYEHFNFFGAPTNIFKFLQNSFPNTIGVGFEAMGMYTNPYDKNGFPIGLADAPVVPGSNVKTLNWTCASCHFGKTEDGRYVVGQSNVKYEYGKQLLALTTLPLLVGGQANMEDIAPETIELLQPMLDEWNENPNYWGLIINLLPLASLPDQAGMTVEQQKAFASWKAGVQDPLMFPTQTDDKTHSALKIPSAYGVPSHKDFEDMDMDPHTHLRIGWAGATDNMYRFARSFVALGTDDPDDWDDARFKPLVEYILSLEAPKTKEQLDSDKVAAGKQLFTDKGCASCHNGPNYMGTEVYDFDEIGTDSAHKWMWDSDRDYGPPVPDITPTDPQRMTHAIKAPKLVGLWTQDKFLHNGSVDSLEELFCVDHERPRVAHEALQPFSNAGHMYTCDDLSVTEKQALIEFLKSL